MTAIEFNTRLVEERTSLKGFALSLTRNLEEAQDLLQETYLKALKYRSKFKESTNLRAWLFTIMKNTFINTYRRNSKTKQLMSKGDEHALIRAYNQNYYDHHNSRISMKEIVAAIDKLDDNYKVPFIHSFNGFKYEEIAHKMNLPIGTVKSRIFHARKILMGQLAHYKPN
ncbi:MAG: RNA polymerase sigma factor [Bacteroidia bacterium]